MINMADETQNLNRIKRWMIAYDISNHRKRRFIHNLLKNHGQRVQYSVFECELSKQQQHKLRKQLCQHMEAGDSIRWYPLCRWCEPKVSWTGKGQAPKFDRFHLL